MEIDELMAKRVYKLAKEIYANDQNTYMPSFDELPYLYAQGYLNDAYERIKKRPQD